MVETLVPKKTSRQIKIETLSSLGDSSLVERSLQGEELAFEVLHNRHYHRVRRFVFNIVQDTPRSLDLTQNTFLRVHLHLHRFILDRKFTTWVLTIAKRLAWNDVRNHKRRGEYVLLDRLEQSLPIILVEENEIEHIELRLKIASTLEKIPPRYRRIIELRAMELKDYEEIGRILDIPLGTVKSRLFRARESFREAFENDGRNKKNRTLIAR